MASVGLHFSGLRQLSNEQLSVQERNSRDLVPGDIVNLSYPELAVVPADMILLTGDAIVNESMLTGESVPVSKGSIQDINLIKWRESGDVAGHVAKGFLYCGTRVVRIRGTTQGSEESPALGLVVRTGMSMLNLERLTS